jgi:hypothetical protein
MAESNKPIVIQRAFAFRRGSNQRAKQSTGTILVTSRTEGLSSAVEYRKNAAETTPITANQTGRERLGMWAIIRYRVEKVL